MVKGFLCPVCGKLLIEEEKSYKCENNHCFDKAKQGYVNLLPSNSQKGHGDNKLMINARREFLQKGYYEHLKNKLCEVIEQYSSDGFSCLDSGCGESYYTKGIYETVCKKYGQVYAIDVSKEALKFASKSCDNVKFAVASAYKMPFDNECFDIITSVFAPLAKDEFYRILKENGLFITVFPLENHLFSLKKAIYDAPYPNKPENTELSGFELVLSEEIKKNICLNCNEDIVNLFMMTPYYYKTSSKDQKKMNDLKELMVETEFMLLVYRKIKQ